MNQRRRGIAALATTAVVFGLFAAGAVTEALAAAPDVSFANAVAFPNRALLLTAPATVAVRSGSVHVTENGRQVPRASVTQLSSAQAGDFGVALLIDSSMSMRGAPISQALAAARTLASERTGKQELEVIEFNRTTRTLTPLTSDGTQISRALSTVPTLAVGTRIYDATLQAIQDLRRGGVAAANVIIVSDGRDVGSRVSQEAVAAASASENVHLYTVGVRDGSFKPETLMALATATHGSFTSATGSGLDGVFTKIESQLKSRFLIRYRSSEHFNRPVAVGLRVDGLAGVWSGSYRTPALPPLVKVPATPRVTPAKPTFWRSSLALILVIVACSMLMALSMVFYRGSRAREHGLRDRIRRFTTAPEPDAESGTPQRSAFGESVDRWLARYGWGRRFAQEVDVAALDSSPGDIVLLVVALTIPSALIISILTGSAVLAILVCLIAPVLMVFVVRQKADHQRRLFQEQLAPHLEEIGSAMRAGYSVVASIASMADDAVDPSQREFRRALADEQIGVPIDEALAPVAARMRCRDLDQLGLVASLNQRTGGNMAEILDLIANGVRERAELKRELDALTAQAKLSRWVVSALPPGVLLMMLIIRPSYVRPLFNTATGALVLIAATGLLVLGSVVMHFILESGE